MTRCVGWTISVLLAIGAAGGCAGTSGTGQQELQRARAGSIDVILLSEGGSLREGMDAFTIEFRRGADGTLVDVGTVKAAATMPMPGLPSMLGSVFIEPGDAPGRYRADTDLSMAGGWDLSLEWDGPEGRGRVSFAMTVAPGEVR